MGQMSGAQAVIHTLEREGVEVLFGLPGSHTLSIYDALLDSTSIRHVAARHEQGAAFMADGYAYASGKIGVCLLTPGPGAANAMTPLIESYVSCLPILVIIGQIPSQIVDSGKGGIHEVKNHRQMMESVSCWYRRVSAFEEIPGAIRNAFTYLYTSRPGPAILEIPNNFLEARGECEIPELPSRSRITPDPKQLARAANLLKSARFPLMFAGGGVIHSGAFSQIRELCERLRIPVVTSSQGKGGLPEDHPLSLGCTNGVNPFRGSPTKSPFYERFLCKIDVLLSVGTQYDQTTSDGWRFPIPSTHIQIDLDPSQIGKNFSVSEGIVGDAAQVLQGILGCLGDLRASVRPELEEEIAAVKREVQVLLRQRSTVELNVLAEIRQVLSRDAIVSNDMTQITYWAGRYFPVYLPRTFFFPYGSTTLGSGLPAAIGAKVACPGRQVVALCGDGGFLFNCQELATLARQKLPVVVVVFNDNSYGVLKEFQQERFGRVTEADLLNPDFVKLAEAFGIKGVRVEKLGDLSQALDEALGLGEPVLVEAPAAGFTAPWMSIV